MLPQVAVAITPDLHQKSGVASRIKSAALGFRHSGAGAILCPV